MTDLIVRLRDCSYENAPSRCFEAADEITRLRSDLECATKALEEIDRQYENQDLSHKDFRIGAKVVTDAALTEIAH